MTAQQAWPSIKAMALSKMDSGKATRIEIRNLYLLRQFGLKQEELEAVVRIVQHDGELKGEFTPSEIILSRRAKGGDA